MRILPDLRLKLYYPIHWLRVAADAKCCTEHAPSTSLVALGGMFKGNRHKQRQLRVGIQAAAVLTQLALFARQIEHC